MTKWPAKLGANCEDCPLKRQRVCGNDPAAGPTKFMVIADGPSRVDVDHRRKRPLIDRAGGLLNTALKQLDISRPTDTHVTLAVTCLPKKHMKDKEWTKALECCKPRLEKEREAIGQVPIVLLGKYALGKGRSIRAWRGYPLEHGFPTYHPTFLLKEPFHTPFFNLDLYRVTQLGPPDWKWGEAYYGTPQRELEGLERLLDTSGPIGVDVENGGSEHPMIDPLICVGVGTSAFAVTVQFPFQDRGVELAIRALLKSNRIKVLQNMNHDRLSLLAKNVEFFGSFYDTLAAGCVIASKAYHDLGTMHNYYYYAPRWKTQFHASGDDRKGAKAFINSPYKELAEYNAKDVMATCQVMEGQLG
jgi:uracil-DNA glycosylase family 4